MSRLAKNGITISEGVEVLIDDGVLAVKGPKGELKKNFRDGAILSIDNGVVNIEPKTNSKFNRSLVGTYAAHLKNMMIGVTVGFSKKLIIEGTGYRFELAGKELVLSVGFSHPVRIAIPEGITLKVEKSELTISGNDKEIVGQFSASIRNVKKPEPYKGKGIKYEGERILRKSGKSGKEK